MIPGSIRFVLTIATFAVVGAVVGGFVLPFIWHHALLPLFDLEWMSAWGVPSGGYVIAATPVSVPTPLLNQVHVEAYRQLQVLPLFGALGAFAGILAGLHAAITKRACGATVASLYGALIGLPFVLAAIDWAPRKPTGNAMMDDILADIAWSVPLHFCINFTVNMALAALVAQRLVRRWL
jgi:hypothetical protein